MIVGLAQTQIESVNGDWRLLDPDFAYLAKKLPELAQPARVLFLEECADTKEFFPCHLTYPREKRKVFGESLDST